MLPRLLIFIVVAIAMVFIAKRKGFNPLYWVIAGSVIGFVILLVLPAATANNISDEERVKREKFGNSIGMLLSAVVLIFGAMVAVIILVPGTI